MFIAANPKGVPDILVGDELDLYIFDGYVRADHDFDDTSEELHIQAYMEKTGRLIVDTAAGMVRLVDSEGPPVAYWTDERRLRLLSLKAGVNRVQIFDECATGLEAILQAGAYESY